MPGRALERDQSTGARTVREILEELELGLRAPLELVHHGTEGPRERFIYCAPLEVEPDDLVVHEGQGAALLSREDLARIPVVPAHRRILEECFRHWSGM